MPMRLTHTQLLRYAGLFTWAVVGVPLALSSWYFPIVEPEEIRAASTDLVNKPA